MATATKRAKTKANTDTTDTSAIKPVKRKRARKAREKLPLTYAEDLGLKCKAFLSGTRLYCGEPAEFFEPGLGDLCSDHKRSDKAIHYSKKPQSAVATA